jgi:Fuc2NAc and GlcNAc transferase
MIFYHYHSFNDIINWYILLGVFIFDATITLYRRAKIGEKLSIAHKKHAFQRLVQSGFSHQKVVLYAMGINIISIFIIFALDKSNYLIFFFVCYNIFMFMLLKIIDKRRAF